MPTKPTTLEAKDAVNVFASIDVLGMLADTELPSLGGKSVEDGIKDYYQNALTGNATAAALYPWLSHCNPGRSSKMHLYLTHCGIC